MGCDSGACPSHQKTFQPCRAGESVDSVTLVAPTLTDTHRGFFFSLWTVGVVYKVAPTYPCDGVWDRRYCYFSSATAAYFSSAGSCCWSLARLLVLLHTLTVAATESVLFSLLSRCCFCYCSVSDIAATNSISGVGWSEHGYNLVGGECVCVNTCVVRFVGCGSLTGVYVCVCVWNIVLPETAGHSMVLPVCFCLFAVSPSISCQQKGYVADLWPQFWRERRTDRPPRSVRVNSCTLTDTCFRLKLSQHVFEKKW